MKENNFAMPDSNASTIPLRFESNLPFQSWETTANFPNETTTDSQVKGFEPRITMGSSNPNSTLISPQNRLEGSQKASFKETHGHKKMVEDLAFFNENHGTYFSNIINKLGLNEVQIRALIGHESRFVHNAKNIKGSKGYMQLTGAPIRDLESRPHLYAAHYSKIDLRDIPESAPKELRELIEIFQAGPASYKKIRGLISGLLAKKDEPSVNLTIGSIYMASLGHRLETRGVPEKISAFTEKKIKILSSSSFLSLVARRVQDQLPQSEISQVRNILKNTKGSPDLQKQFLQLRDYNGNVSKYGSSIEHRDIYAAVVLVVSELAKKDSVMKARIA